MTCSNNYNCGANLIVPYPFWGGNKPRYSGRDGFQVKCLSPETLSILIASQNFTIVNINPAREIVKMVRTDITSYDNCSFHFTSTSLDSALFTIYPNVMNMTLFYDCVPASSIGQNNFTCRDNIQKQGFFGSQTQLGQFTELSKHYRVQIQVPVTWGVTVDPFGGTESLKNALDKGFDVQWERRR
ncbi:hypothetical protein K1719_030094 [Acacia pycnantha]|nr:hypothetical protein K1719_030094 [Acacia pycnantha]